MAADVTEYALATLKAASAVTNLVIDGAAGILEAGDATPKTLEDAQAARYEAGNPAKVLAISVVDAGEKAQNEQVTEQRAGVLILDRERGYSNVRKARKAIYAALHGKSTPLTSPLDDRTVVVIIEFDSRTGYIHERGLEVDLEYMVFKAIINLDLG